MNANSEPDDAVNKLANEILAYLAENPRSSDTIVGIHQWWLCNRSHSTAELQEALDYLVEVEILEKQTRTNRDEYYSIRNR